MKRLFLFGLSILANWVTAVSLVQPTLADMLKKPLPELSINIFSALVQNEPEILAKLGKSKERYTVFAPTDKAFEKIGFSLKAGRVVYDKSLYTPKLLSRILKNHIVEGNYTVKEPYHKHLPSRLETLAEAGIEPQKMQFQGPVQMDTWYAGGRGSARNGSLYFINDVQIPEDVTAKIHRMHKKEPLINIER